MQQAEDDNRQPDPFTEMWAEFVSKMAAAGLAFQADAPPPAAARQVRDAMFGAMGRCCDEFMRSPEFLKAMKQSVDGAVALRKQFNAQLGHILHEMQGVTRDDADGLFEAVEDLQTRVLDRLEQMSARIEALSRRVDELAAAGPAPRRPAAPAAARRPAQRMKGKRKR